tara:strand:- start:17789 stop:19141 length:1353 start_codon:yes stop_codon:yes gene_type:complete
MNRDIQSDDKNLLDDVLKKALINGADSADGIIIRSTTVSHSQRLGKIEKLEREESMSMGLRVFSGKKQAIVSSTTTKPEVLDELVLKVIAMANSVPDDPWCGLADPKQLATQTLDLEISDSKEPNNADLITVAQECEESALEIDGVTNSEGAESSWNHNEVSLVATNGFSNSYSRTNSSLSVSVIAGQGTDMESDYDFSQAVFFSDLKNPRKLGASAGRRAVSHLGSRKMPTSAVPVVFDPRIANSFLGHLISAISGPAVATGTSFLKDSLYQPIFSSNITIVDDPHMPRGLRSKPFDSEGLDNQKINFVEDGVLSSWLLDLASSRQLGFQSTGRAARSTSSPPSPSPTNLYLEPGPLSPAELMADIKNGFYVSSLMGMGVNGVTGDYSRGANGFWIENGKLSFPVSEITIAGNLIEIYKNIVPANDLNFLYGINSPTIRVDGLTVAGST